MSNVFAVFLIGSVAFGGPIGAGVRVGVPATELVMSSDHDSGAYRSSGGRYVIGPMVEFRLPSTSELKWTLCIGA
jgi:hypothetical protein